MAEAWMEIFAPEIKESNIRAAVDSLADYITLDEAIRHVAEKYDVTIEAVKLILEKRKAAV